MKRLITFLMIFFGLVIFTDAQNKYLNFEGDNDYVSISTLNSDGWTVLTIEAWVYAHSFNAGGDPDYKISNIAGHDNASSLLRIGDSDPAELDANNIPQFVILAPGQVKCSATTEMSTNTWYHIAGTYDGSNLKIYVNGILETTEPHTGNISSSSAGWNLGGTTSSSRYFDGLMDEVRVWNTARTQEQIRQNMYREVPDPTSETNLIAYYQMNDNLNDASSNSYTGTFNGGTATYAPSSAFFGPKRALDFDGTDEYVSINDADALDLTNNFTIEAWIYAHSFGSMEGIVSKYHTGGANGYMLRLTYDSPFSGISFCEVDTDQGVLSTNTWHHVVGVMSDGSVSIYIDGIEQSVTGTTLNLQANTDPLRIGVDFLSSPRYFDGLIEEVRIWSDVRTEVEIWENMNRSLTGNEDGLVAYYNMDNSSGSDLQNVNQVAAYDGVLTNMEDADWVASSAFNTWLNTSSTAWGTDANWSDGEVPSSSDNVGIINHSGGSQPTIATALSCASLVVGSGVSLTDNYSSGTHAAGKNVIVNGTMHVKAGNELDVTKSLIVATNGTLDVEPLGKVTVDNNMKVNGSGKLRLNSDATGTGSMIIWGTATGNVEMERYIAGADWSTGDDGWHFLSSPVAAQAINSGGFTTDPYDFYCWWELTNEWVNYKNNSTEPTWSTANVLSNSLSNPTTNFVVGKGYLGAYDDAGIKSFTGTLNVADVAITGLDITTGGTNSSWHLLGNPFSSGLSWDNSWPGPNIGENIQIWNENGKSYTVLNKTTTGTIPATNGFMAQALEPEATITIPSGNRVHGGTFYKGDDIPAIKLKANNLDFPSFQESQVLIIPGSSEGYEPQYDCDFLPGYAPLFYSTSEGMPIALNSIPNLSETTVIPFTFVKNEGLNFSIEMYEVDNIEMDVWLLDKKMNIEHNLSLNPIYTFSAFEQDDPNRFVIHFSPLDVDELDKTDQISIYASDGKVVIKNSMPFDAVISIYSISGQLLQKSQIVDHCCTSVELSGYKGLAVVILTNETRNYNKKVLIW